MLSNDGERHFVWISIHMSTERTSHDDNYVKYKLSLESTLNSFPAKEKTWQAPVPQQQKKHLSTENKHISYFLFSVVCFFVFGSTQTNKQKHSASWWGDRPKTQRPSLLWKTKLFCSVSQSASETVLLRVGADIKKKDCVKR